MRIFTLILLLVIYSFSIPAQDASPSFEAQTIDNKVSIGYGLAIGDVDGDGKSDILLADKKQFVWYRNGDWKRFVMIENLTEYDNVCIAARDIDGDGKVEVAVGAQWNPGETNDLSKSGSIHYLIRPKDPKKKWEAVKLPHEPTVHRMRWARLDENKFSLIVVPLHGRGNKDGAGEGVKVMAYEKPQDPRQPWPTSLLDDSMHMTHNLDVVESDNQNQTQVYLGGKEGISLITSNNGNWPVNQAQKWSGIDVGVGEIRAGHINNQLAYLAAIEPMHGNRLAVYPVKGTYFSGRCQLLDDDLGEGHALACADFIGLDREQLVVGWRKPNENNKVGIKLFIPQDYTLTKWDEHWIDENSMACEDLQVADLDNDGKMDIIASGRSTNNLKIYWNRTQK